MPAWLTLCKVDARRIERWLIAHCCEFAAAGNDMAALRDVSREHGEKLRAAGIRLFADWLRGVGL